MYEYKYHKYKQKYLKIKEEEDEITKTSKNPINWQDINLQSFHDLADRLKRHMQINYSNSLSYRETPKSHKTSLHQGQRKLLMNEIYFLTQYGHLSNKVVYVGSASGIHLVYLHKLFPKHIFHLYDPRDFYSKLYDISNIHIHQEYFTNEIAKKYVNKNILFISDIRIMPEDAYVIDPTRENPIQAQVKIDMELQKEWVNIIKPTMSMLKFRLPYDDEKVEYLAGDIYLQPWAPQNSTETRLITDGKNTKIYDSKSYNNALYYHNNITRLYQKYILPFDIHKIDGFLNEYDSVCEIFILYLYFSKSHKNDIYENIIESCKEINKLLGKNNITN